MDRCDKPLILIRADTLSTREDGLSNYDDTLNKNLFFTKPSDFHDKLIINGQNTGMFDEVDGSYLSSPKITIKKSSEKEIELSLQAEAYDLDEVKSDLSIFNLSYIGVSKKDVTDKFNINNPSLDGFKDEFIKDIVDSKLVEGRGLSFISGDDFEKLFKQLDSSYEKLYFYASWVRYEDNFRKDPDEKEKFNTELIKQINFTNSVKKQNMHEFRFCLSSSYNSANNKQINYSFINNIGFKPMDNFFDTK